MDFQKLERILAKYYKETLDKLFANKQYARASQMTKHMTALKKELDWIERYGDEIDAKLESEVECP